MLEGGTAEGGEGGGRFDLVRHEGRGGVGAPPPEETEGVSGGEAGGGDGSEGFARRADPLGYGEQGGAGGGKRRAVGRVLSVARVLGEEGGAAGAAVGSAQLP